jgi:hypothetical protein
MAKPERVMTRARFVGMDVVDIWYVWRGGGTLIRGGIHCYAMDRRCDSELSYSLDLSQKTRRSKQCKLYTFWQGQQILSRALGFGPEPR